MVSELSARLLKGYSITYSTSRPLDAGKSCSGFSSASSSQGSSNSSSSNSTPDSQRPSLAPRSLSSGNNNNEERVSSRDACFKRRKIDELRFAASTVKEDLEKGGLSFPSIHAKNPRALHVEGHDINMSSITLLGAKAVADSPFLTKIAGKRSYYESMGEIDQLFQETRHVYAKSWIQGDGLDWDKSSAGSLTSDSESSCAVDISPLLEDSLKYRSSGENKPSLQTPMKTVSMRTALENNSEPRLVTLSFAPFIIIHVNSAYTRMTGIAATDVLGKPLREVFKDKRCKAMAANVSSLAGMHDQLTSVSAVRQDKRCDCRLNISLVGSEIKTETAMPATHCMVAFQATGSESPSFASQAIAASVSHHVSLPCEVMG